MNEYEMAEKFVRKLLEIEAREQDQLNKEKAQKKLVAVKSDGNIIHIVWPGSDE